MITLGTLRTATTIPLVLADRKQAQASRGGLRRGGGIVSGAPGHGCLEEDGGRAE